MADADLTAGMPAAGHDTAFFGHPRGLKTLFFTEMWERFSYYGMRAILILFMTAPVASGGLGFDVAHAGTVYGLYTAMVYLACLPGGWLADRLLGLRHATFTGGVVIMCGHIALAVPTLTSFYLGLVLLVVGTGLLKPNISTLVGQLYGVGDGRRDAGYSLYYMGINVGAFMAPLVCGWLGQGTGFREMLTGFGLDPALSWHFGFGAAAVGMAAGLVHYLHGARHLGEAGARPPRDDAVRDQLSRGVVTLVAVVIVGTVLAYFGVVELSAAWIGNAFGVLLLVITVAFFGWVFAYAEWSVAERRRLWLVLVLFVGATVFWSLYEQGGSTLNLFAERNTDTTLFGFDFPASWMQSLNPIFIICGLAPAFAWLWFRLGPREPSSPAKFALGLLFMALGYAVMIGAAANAAAGVRVSPLWLTTMYFLHTIGEMCLSPVGLSAMSRLAPARIAGLTMGIWFLATSIGSYVGGRVAGLYDTLALTAIFGVLTAVALVACLVMAALVRPLRRALG
ncbi:MAG: peptide MFS transporter [Piscinibacter sp.]|uniref:peptide MFS transporter n=1 Tax=Piscinibacter sp. TaxID=1903157 RepID=UPI003D11CE2B